jgi:hypothetical protein
MQPNEMILGPPLTRPAAERGGAIGVKATETPKQTWEEKRLSKK